jgi:hypothetical protein
LYQRKTIVSAWFCQAQFLSNAKQFIPFCLTHLFCGDTKRYQMGEREMVGSSERRRTGRPKTTIREKPGEYIGFRAPSELKAALETTATAAGRSLSTEVQFRLAQSFRGGETLDDALQMAYGPQGAELLRLLGRITRGAPGARGMDIEDDWADDPTAFSIAERSIKHALERLRPAGDPLPLTGESPEGRVDRLLVALGKIEPPAEWREDVR